MFTKVLVANRGEIACRIAATARKLGIQTVAVYSEADANAKHVAVCDEALLIGPAAAKKSYLRIDKIIDAALAAGAQAVHPGYGFLSENADFADACIKAGLVFIGPPASAIRAMGSKSAAKSLMEKAGVPLVPGYHGDNQDADFLQTQADLIGYPVLLKPSAGGGGKGMRVVEQPNDFASALASCKREAISAFGDDKVLIEKYLSHPRHIEIQIFADSHGNCVHLFERDCSVQRRHQKVLEEAPAPSMTPQRRASMGEAAIAAAQAVGYVGAGTVEFIATQDGAFFFMEMNTRLQVEHPVTEMITRLDLVEWQLRVAFGEPLPLPQAALAINGHAIEARIYAENPDKDFLPSIGPLRHLRTPTAVAFAISDNATHTIPAAVRIDSGVREGDLISPFYDPMIAKLIVWGKDRDDALAQMKQALADYQIVGPATNLTFLKRLIASRSFSDGDLDTGLIERNRDTLFPVLKSAPIGVLALATVALIHAEKNTLICGTTGVAGDPWNSLAGWRMHGTFTRALDFSDALTRYCLSVTYQVEGWSIQLGNTTAGVTLIARHGPDFHILLEDVAVHGSVVSDDDFFHVFHDGTHYPLAFSDPMKEVGVSETDRGRLTAPMPGKVVAVLARKNQAVKKGDPLIIMEAMKMEHTITAPSDGLIEDILYAVGDQVTDGTPLLVFKSA